MRIPVVGALVLLTAHTLAAPGQEPGKPARLKVSVDLSFSVAEYDPRNPGKATVKCVVRNGSKDAVDVAVGYGGRAVSLTSGSLTLYRRVKAGAEPVKFVRLAPGKEQLVFELPLADILKGERKFGSTWAWSWDRRPAPPLSPIHAHRKAGFVERATFVARVEVGGQVVASGPAVLKVKDSK